MSVEGRKDDQGKMLWHLFTWRSAEEVVKVLTYGAGKYAPDNWQKVPDARNRYFDAALRHLCAWRNGQARDPESGQLHLAHAACCVLFLIWFEVTTPRADVAGLTVDEAAAVRLGGVPRPQSKEALQAGCTCKDLGTRPDGRRWDSAGCLLHGSAPLPLTTEVKL